MGYLTAVLLQLRVTQSPSLYVTMHHPTCGGLVSLVCAHLLLPQLKKYGVATTLITAPKLAVHRVGFVNMCCNHIYDFNINIPQLVLPPKLEERNKEKKKRQNTHKNKTTKPVANPQISSIQFLKLTDVTMPFYDSSIT